MTTTFQKRMAFQTPRWCTVWVVFPSSTVGAGLSPASGSLHGTEVTMPVLPPPQPPAPPTRSPVLDCGTASQAFHHKSHTKGTSTAIPAQLINSQAASGSSAPHQANQWLSNRPLGSDQRSRQAKRCPESPWDPTMKKPCTFLADTSLLLSPLLPYEQGSRRHQRSPALPSKQKRLSRTRLELLRCF